MPITKAEIDSNHQSLADAIRADYHDNRAISHEEYHTQLNTEYERYTAELIAEGYLRPPEPIVFTASPPGEALGVRLTNIEGFLKRLYPE